MNIAIAAPRGGVGSSTFAVLLARHWGGRSDTLLLDGAPDPSLDLYTGTSHQILPDFNGNLSECLIPLEDMGRTKLAVIDPSQLIRLDLSTQKKPSGSDLIIDVGTPDDEVIAFLAANEIPVILVLTQDNTVLRAADSLLGTLRRSGVRCGFVVSFHEDRNPQELADLDELFSLLEEDFYGVIPLSADLRIQMNQGKPGEAARNVWAAVRTISDTLETTFAHPSARPGESGGWIDAEDSSDSPESDESGESLTVTLSEEPLAREMAPVKPDEADHDQISDGKGMDDLMQETEGVFSKIKQFFQNFGKGN